MNRIRPSRNVIVLEGPDGGGKTTLGLELAAALRYRYVHLEAMTNVQGGMPRMSVEAVLPALHGYQGVVLDRCWRSDPIYGAVFRDGDDRVGPENAAMLERVLARCQPIYVLCLPPVEACLEAFRSRKGAEYLDTEAQLAAVHQGYAQTSGQYDVVYDRTLLKPREMAEALDARLASQRIHLDLRHSTALNTAGWLDAPVAIMGEGFGERKDCDPLQQYPFVSFSGHGCSRWLTRHLLDNKIPERKLVWLNADMDPTLVSEFLASTPAKALFALGSKACEAASKLHLKPGTIVHHLNHPQYAKRFRKPFELADQLAAYTQENIYD